MAAVSDSPTDGQAEIVVPEEVFEVASESFGAFFEQINKLPRETIAHDFLDLSKSYRRAAIIERYTPLEGIKALEVGTGFGTNIAVWLKHFHADAWGVEPAEKGFDQAYWASRALLTANGLDPDRVIDATGEALPFPDESFDLVYCANVLEHSENPERVVMESLRVLRPGGVLHVEVPNFLSYFEGHYFVIQPPIIWKPILGWWVRLVFRRDPAYAATLQTKINPIWCRRVVAQAQKRYDVTLVSVGDDLFLERLKQPFAFETQGAANKAGKAVAAFRVLNVGNWLGRLVVLLQGHYPIYLTVRKGDGESNRATG
jgi:SAM-dependent methyltransferase